MANLLINLPEEMGGLGFPSPGNHAGRVAGGGQVVQALDGRSRGSRFWAHKAKGVVFGHNKWRQLYTVQPSISLGMGGAHCLSCMAYAQ